MKKTKACVAAGLGSRQSLSNIKKSIILNYVFLNYIYSKIEKMRVWLNVMLNGSMRVSMLDESHSILEYVLLQVMNFLLVIIC